MQFINSDGGISSGNEDGIMVCDATNDQGNSIISKIDEDSAIVAWEDSRAPSDYNEHYHSYNRDIYAQKIIISENDIDEESINSLSINLSNYPNPFNPSTTISFEIAKKIQDEMTYPGQIKVTVIRETRAINYAK